MLSLLAMRVLIQTEGLYSRVSKYCRHRSTSNSPGFFRRKRRLRPTVSSLFRQMKLGEFSRPSRYFSLGQQEPRWRDRSRTRAVFMLLRSLSDASGRTAASAAAFQLIKSGSHAHLQLLGGGSTSLFPPPSHPNLCWKANKSPTNGGQKHQRAAAELRDAEDCGSDELAAASC